jgi:hypothetical protein
MPREGFRVVPVIGHEDVVAPVSVEVGDQNLPAVLRPRDRPHEHRAPVPEAAAPVREEDADRKRRMRDGEGEPGDDDVGEPVPVQITRLLFRHPTDAARRRDDPRWSEARYRVDCRGCGRDQRERRDRGSPPQDHVRFIAHVQLSGNSSLFKLDLRGRRRTRRS